MKKTVKIFFILILFFGLLPALAGVAVTQLWNSVVTAACGFAAITFWQGVGLFVLGQILTGGILLGLFLAGGAVHAMGHRRGEWHRHWHNMTDGQRREFIENRRRSHFRFRNPQNRPDDAAR